MPIFHNVNLAPASKAMVRHMAGKTGRTAPTAFGVRTFQSGSLLCASKETAPADESRKQDIEREKQALLKAQREGKGEWRQGLASESESAIKADRGEVKADKGTIEELQKEGAEAAKREREREGK